MNQDKKWKNKNDEKDSSLNRGNSSGPTASNTNQRPLKEQSIRSTRDGNDGGSLEKDSIADKSRESLY